jgi:tetratricopeptide (TPR) repeat protein
LALGSKEIAAFLPFVLFLYEWFFFQHRSISWIRRTIWPLVGTIIVLSFAVLVYTGFEPFRTVLSGYSHRDFTMLQRVLTQFRVIPYYIGLIVYPHPHRLSLLHDFDISRSLLDPPSTIICAAGITLAVLSACWMSKKEPLLAFAIFWFFGNLVIESSVVGLEIIFEHRTYLPSMLVSFLIVMLSFRYIGNTILATALLCVVVGTFSLWTYERNALWKDKVAFWEDCAKKATSDVRVYHNLGNAYLETDRLDDAMKAYEQALNVDPTFTKSLVGLGHALREKGDIVGAIAAHKKAIEGAPRDSSSYDHLGADYIETNEMNLAIQALKKAIDLGPYNYSAYNNLGFAYSKTGDVSKAVTMYEQSIAIRPDFAAAYNNLGVLFLNPAQSKKAMKVLRKALEIDPGYVDAYSNMGIALIYGGNFKKGIHLIKVALELESDHQDATFNLARAYELLGDYHSAVDQYKNSIHLNPRDVDAYFNAGFIYLNHLLNNKKALVLLKQGLSIDSSHKKATVVKEAIYQLENTNQNAT